jgi:hypothetical protein
MIAPTSSVDKLSAQWRSQILARRNPPSISARGTFVATSFIDQSNARSAFVDIDHLLVVLLYEDRFLGSSAAPRRRVPLRFVAYGASRIPHGILWGGIANNRFFKDLTLIPQFRACGQRIDRSNIELTSLALKLNHRLRRAARLPAVPWRELRLPRLWAGFRRSVASVLRGDGPEFECECASLPVDSNKVFRKSARTHFGLTLYPMDWVSNQLELAVAVFADVTPALRRQVCRFNGLPDSLTGYCGASEFDFYTNRFRKLHQTRRSHSSPIRTKVSTLATSRKVRSD